MTISFWRRLRHALSNNSPSGSACLMCGDCCRSFGGHLNASKSDLNRWAAAGRNDLLRRVNRLGWIWINPDNGQLEPHCPFLTQTPSRHYVCGIHQLKPDICRAYPTLAHGRRCLKGVFLRLLPLVANLCCWAPELADFCLV